MTPDCELTGAQRVPSPSLTVQELEEWILEEKQAIEEEDLEMARLLAKEDVDSMPHCCCQTESSNQHNGPSSDCMKTFAESSGTSAEEHGCPQTSLKETCNWSQAVSTRRLMNRTKNQHKGPDEEAGDIFDLEEVLPGVPIGSHWSVMPD